MTTLLSQIEQQPYSLDIAVSRKRELDGKFFGRRQLAKRIQQPAISPVENPKPAAKARLCGSPWIISEGIKIQPDWQLVEEFIGDVSQIKREVAAKYRVGINEIDSKRRHKRLVQARQEIFWRAKRETTASFPEIGRRVGGKDHTTVLHGVRRYEHWRRVKAGLETVEPRQFSIADIDLIIPLEAGE